MNSEGWVAEASRFGFAAKRSSDCWDRGRPARPRYVNIKLRPSYAVGRPARRPSKSLERVPDLLDTIATVTSEHRLKNRQNRMSHNTDLFIHREEVKIVPGFHDLSISNPYDRHSGKLDRRTAGSNSKMIASVLATH